MNDLITIIIPTFDTPIRLEQSVKSVQGQTFSNWELIVVDDNAPCTLARRQTEMLMSRLLSKDERIIYLQHESNKNGSAARNTGIAHARGKYIAFLDSDDEYAPRRIEQCLRTMERVDENVAGVYTGCEFRREGKMYHTEKNVKSGNFLVETLACTFMFCTGSNLFIRKSVIDELHGFDEAFVRHQDYEFLVRLFERGYSLEAIPEVLVVKNNENKNLPNVEKQIEIKLQYLEKYKDIIESQPSCQYNFIYHKQCISVAEAALRSGNLHVSKEYYAKSGVYGRMTVRERMRRIVFMLLSLIGR